MYIKNKELVIRNAVCTDANVLAAWWNDEKIMAHAGFVNGLWETPNEIAESIKQDCDEKGRRLIIELKEIPIGEMSYRITELKIAEISIKICNFSRRERGYGRILLSMLIRELFYNFGCTKIVLDTNTDNLRARHVYELLGFKKEKIEKDSWRDMSGEWRSTVHYTLTPDAFIDYSKDTMIDCDIQLLHYIKITKDKQKQIEEIIPEWIKYIKELNTDNKNIQLLLEQINLQEKNEQMQFEAVYFMGELIGFTLYAAKLNCIKNILPKRYGYIIEFYVCTPFRRQGIGRIIYKHIQDNFQKEYINTIYLTPYTETEILFWEKMGFCDSGKISHENKKIWKHDLLSV